MVISTIKSAASGSALERGGLIDLEVLLSLLFLRKSIIMIATAATVAATLLLNLVTPAVYESTVQVIAEPAKDQNPYQLEVRSYKDRQYFLETQKELVISGPVVRQTIAALQSRNEETITGREVDAFAERIRVSSRAGQRSGLAPELAAESNTFFVTVQDRNPDDAAKVANLLVEKYLAASLKLRKGQASSALESLSSTVDETSDRTREAHRALVEFEREKAGALLAELMNIDKPTVRVFPELQDIRAEYEKLRVELAEHEAVEGVLQETLDSPDGDLVIPNTVLETNDTISRMKGEILELNLKLNQVLPFFTEESREVLALREQIASLEAGVRDEVKYLLRSERQTIKILEARIKAREESLNGYEQKLSQLSALNSEHAQLKGEYDSLVRALETQQDSLASALAAAAESSVGGAYIEVIDKAQPNYTAVAPRTLRNLVLSILGGFFLGILLVLASHLTNPIFVHPRQLAELTSVPVVGVLGRRRAGA